MESIFTELALYGSKNECARTRSAMVRFPLQYYSILIFNEVIVQKLAAVKTKILL